MATEFKLPQLGENIESIQVVKVLVNSGDTVAVDQPVLELETDKAMIEVPINVAGTVTSVLVAEGDEIKVGQPILEVASSGTAPTAPEAASPPAGASLPVPVAAPVPPPVGSSSPPAPIAPPPAQGSKLVPAAPSVRRFAREIGIDIGQVPGSGGHGRVSREDVKAYARSLNTDRAASTEAGITPDRAPALPDFTKWGETETKKMSVIRHKTAQHMALSWAQCPHVTIFDKVDITEMDALRKKYAPLAEKHGGKLTMAVMVCKIVAHALGKFPTFNASIDMVKKQVILKKYINLGVAVSTPRGLMVPVVRDADTKNMIQLAAEIQVLAAKCRDARIQLDELEGGTFTVTNLGRICGTYFTPIINYPEVAILGMGRAFEEPIVVDGEVAVRTVLPLSLSFDHRLVDGADGAAFMGWVKESIEEPLMLALDG